jgi:prepilin-type N-terminal cleavage/methylation domain-containing protein/prepilin-type processing-associated H-X9-DG protein
MAKSSTVIGIDEKWSKPMTRRAAFTMVELVIVITIISILIALLLPAVQSAREDARRAQCANNLMQLGIALGSYASTHSVLPPGTVNDTGPILNLPSGYHHSWVVQILPFIGQNNIYRHFNFREGAYEASNDTVVSVKISTLICPSDGRPGPSNYAGCYHDVDAPIDADNHGVLYLNSRVRLEDIPDGAAYTILLSEVRGGGPTLGWASGTRATLRNTGVPINAYDPLSASGRFGLTAPGTSGPAKSTRFGNAAPPNPTQVEIYQAVKDLAEDELWPVKLTGGFSSHHNNGANFLFCDGTVRVLKKTIDGRVYRLLGHRHDGEAVSDDSF